MRMHSARNGTKRTETECNETERNGMERNDKHGTPEMPKIGKRNNETGNPDC